mmetsp:Transcript_9064/g.18822  ORF Transcript_9064/g.18822 Transcript_9064/m.18822 type:complete len:84 (-) Transcript_9064:173-424(-)
MENEEYSLRSLAEHKFHDVIPTLYIFLKYRPTLIGSFKSTKSGDECTRTEKNTATKEQNSANSNGKCCGRKSICNFPTFCIAL